MPSCRGHRRLAAERLQAPQRPLAVGPRGASQGRELRPLRDRRRLGLRALRAGLRRVAAPAGGDRGAARGGLVTAAPPTRTPLIEPTCAARTGWPLERVLFALAGTMTLLSVALVRARVSVVPAPDRVRGRQPVAVRGGPGVPRLRRDQAGARVALCDLRPAAMSAVGPIGRLGRWTATHFRLVAAAWILIAVAAGVFAPRVEHALSGAGWEATGSESVEARNLVGPQLLGPLQQLPDGGRARARVEAGRFPLRPRGPEGGGNPPSKRRGERRRAAAPWCLGVRRRPHSNRAGRRGPRLQRHGPRRGRPEGGSRASRRRGRERGPHRRLRACGRTSTTRTRPRC